MSEIFGTTRGNGQIQWDIFNMSLNNVLLRRLVRQKQTRTYYR